MALTVTHAKNVAIADDPKASAAGEVLPSDWNANHIVTGSPDGIRVQLTSPTTYNVATTGTTNGDGSLGSPWPTLQFANDYICKNIDFNGNDVTVNVDDGTYVGASLGFGLNTLSNNSGWATSDFDAPLSATVIWQAKNGDATKVNLTENPLQQGRILEISTTSAVAIKIRNFTFKCNTLSFDFAPIFFGGTGTFFVGESGLGSSLIFDNTGAAFSAGDIFSSFMGFLQLEGNITIKGTFDYFVLCGIQSFCTISLDSLTFSSATFAGAFLWCQSNGQVAVLGLGTVTGTPTGKKFRVSPGSTLDLSLLGGSDLNTLPGTAAGIIQDNGSYAYATGLFSSLSVGGVTTANLPGVAAVAVGARNFVTDSNTSLSAGLGNVVAASTSTSTSSMVPVYSDGTNWRIG